MALFAWMTVCEAKGPHVHSDQEIFNGLGPYALADRPDFSFAHDMNPPGSSSTGWRRARLEQEMELASFRPLHPFPTKKAHGLSLELTASGLADAMSVAGRIAMRWGLTSSCI